MPSTPAGCGRAQARRRNTMCLMPRGAPRGAPPHKRALVAPLLVMCLPTTARFSATTWPSARDRAWRAPTFTPRATGLSLAARLMPRANSARTPAARRRGSSGARAAARRRDLCRSSRGPGHLPVPARTGGSYPSQPKTRPLQQRGASETAAAARCLHREGGSHNQCDSSQLVLSSRQ